MLIMRRPSLAIIVAYAATVLVSSGSFGAERVTVYRCAAADGGISLQDQPCPPSSQESIRRMRRPIDREVPTLKVTAPPPTTPDPEPQAAMAPDAVSPLPPLWLCRDFDGAERESTDGEPRGRYVPLWVVGRDPYAPRQEFGRVGEPLANPNTAPPGSPPTQVDGAPTSSSLIYVAERCYLLSADERCTRFAAQRREIERKIFNSQDSDKAILAPKSARLRQILIEHCRG